MNIKDESQNVYEKSDGRLTDRMMLAVDEVCDGDQVLEIGVGWGELTQNIAKHKKIELFAVDASGSALDKVKDYIVDAQTVDISNEKLKFRDGQFDTVICLEVFEHLQNPYHVLEEIQRVLKPEGKLILSIPNHRGGHLMIYPGLITQKFFRLFLRQNGFEICRSFFWGPILNKDNIGVLFQDRIKNPALSLVCLRFVQVFIRFAQLLTRIVGLKISSLYWCYFFICKNRKDKFKKPFWLKQLEQTSELGDKTGWYNPYYHEKA